jgi:hypothetical protein
MTVLLLGAMIGLLVALDPLLSTYLLRDLPWLHDLPYALSIGAAALVGAVFAARQLVLGFATVTIRDYWRFFPLLFLVSYQLTAVAAGPLDPTDALVAVFMTLFLAGLFVDRDQRFVSTPFNMLHLAIVVCIAISLVAAFQPTGFLRSLKPFVLFFLLVNFLPRDNVIPQFLRWLLVLAMVSAAFALLQQIAWLGAATILSPLSEANVEMMMETVFGVTVFRVPALMTGYRPLALYLGIALVLAVSALLWRRELRLLPRRWLLFGIGLISLALVMTLAKDILLGTGLALVLLLTLYRPARFVPLASVAALTGVLALVVAIAVVPGNIDTAMDLTRTIPKEEVERIRLDRDSIEGFLHGPYMWTGRGVFAGGRYTAHTRRWPAHNAFILAAAEIGVAGVTILLLIYGLAIARLVALNVKVRSGPYLPIVRALSASVLIIVVGAQFEADFLEMFVWTIFATVEAMWILVRRQTRTAVESASGSAAVRSGM